MECFFRKINGKIRSEAVNHNDRWHWFSDSWMEILERPKYSQWELNQMGFPSWKAPKFKVCNFKEWTIYLSLRKRNESSYTPNLMPRTALWRLPCLPSARVSFRRSNIVICKQFVREQTYIKLDHVTFFGWLTVWLSFDNIEKNPIFVDALVYIVQCWKIFAPAKVCHFFWTESEKNSTSILRSNDRAQRLTEWRH